MAVIVSDNTLAGYTGRLSGANQFYVSRANNVGVTGDGTSLGNLITQAVTFTGAGAGEKCKGIAVCISNVVSGPYINLDKSITVGLQEVYTPVTISIASPCVVTYTSHGLSNGTGVIFETTGTLPTGLSKTYTIYYIRSTGADTMNLYDTAAHAIAGGSTGIVNTSGTQSGTHSMWVTRVESTHTAAEINPGSTTSVLGEWLVPFKFASPYTIDSTASKWRFVVYQGAGTNNWRLNYSTAGSYSYVAWGDATATASSTNDTLIVVDKVTIDCNFQLKAILGTGVTTLGVCGWLCRNTDLTADNVALLEWENPAVSSYTFTIDGHLLVSNHSGIRIGTETDPILYASQAKLVFKSVPTAGTTAPSTIRGATSYYHDGMQSLFFYGEIPSITYDTLASDAAAGQKTVITTTSTGWKSGDTVYIGRENTSGSGDTTSNTLNGDASGTTITLTNNIAGQKRYAGGHIINVTRYGIWMSSDGATSCDIVLYGPNNITFSGVRFSGAKLTTGLNNAYTRFDSAANYSQTLIQDCAFEGVGKSTMFLQAYYICNPKGFVLNRCNFTRQVPAYATWNKVVEKSFTTPQITGAYTMTNNIIMHNDTYGIFVGVSGSPGFTNVVIDVENNFIENGVGGIGITGTSTIFKNNSVYSTSSTTIAGLNIFNLLNPSDISGNTLNRCVTGIYFYASAAIIGSIIESQTFGNLIANTTDVDFSTGTYVDCEVVTPTGLSTVSTTNLPELVLGSKFKVTNFSATNDDRVYTPYGYFQRTTSGLSDTTVHTVGGSAIRFQSTSSTVPLQWTFTIPTGNIQNKSMMVGIWCNINNAAYWAGTYQLPRLTVDYDNGTTTYMESGAKTGWQFLYVPFTPTTTYGQITVTVSTMTDATTTNAYVYFDDFKTLFPAEAPLNTQTLDLWANALPVTPPIATVLSANDVWSAANTIDYGSNTMGEKVAKKLLTTSKFIGLK